MKNVPFENLFIFFYTFIQIQCKKKSSDIILTYGIIRLWPFSGLGLLSCFLMLARPHRLNLYMSAGVHWSAGLIHALHAAGNNLMNFVWIYWGEAAIFYGLKVSCWSYILWSSARMTHFILLECYPTNACSILTYTYRSQCTRTELSETTLFW